MKVGIIQSNYLPWKGYFDFIDDVDLFVFHDDLQYTKNDWRNRNKIKTQSGLKWLTVPVKYNSVSQLISETPIDNSQNWQKKHLNQLKENYQSAGYFSQIYAELNEIICIKYPTISELNISLIKWVMKKLNINTPVIHSRELKPAGSRTERLIDILTKLNADTYLSGPSASEYLDLELFRNTGIGLEYKSYSYLEYNQQFLPFEHGVTILDLIFNIGIGDRKYFKSLIPGQIIIAQTKNTKYIETEQI